MNEIKSLAERLVLNVEQVIVGKRESISLIVTAINNSGTQNTYLGDFLFLWALIIGNKVLVTKV